MDEDDGDDDDVNFDYMNKMEFENESNEEEGAILERLVSAQHLGIVDETHKHLILVEAPTVGSTIDHRIVRDREFRGTPVKESMDYSII